VFLKNRPIYDPIHFLGDLRQIDEGDLAGGHFVANRPSFGRFDTSV
jgi:hypothetical protein